MSPERKDSDDLLERYEYYWLDGRVVEAINRRRNDRVRWGKSTHEKSRLIVSYWRARENQRTILKQAKGPQITPDRHAESFLRYSRYFCDPNSSDLGAKLPEVLVQKVVDHANTATDMVIAQWEATGEEEGQTQQLAGRLNELSKFQHGEWEVSIRVRVASKQTKEPIVGADMGIIVDIRRGSDQVVKASLVQAKRVEVIPADILESLGLLSQVSKMKSTKEESYGLVYSSQSTQFFEVDGPPLSFISVQQFFTDKLRCTRGDRNPIAIAQAYDRSTVIDVTVATGEPLSVAQQLLFQDR